MKTVHLLMLAAVVAFGCEAPSVRSDARDLAVAGQTKELRGWLNWRGPQQNGTSLEKGLPDAWEVGGVNHLWDVPIRGRGAPVVADGRVFSWCYRGEQTDLVELLVCLDEQTGEILWEREVNDFISENIYNRYTIGAPIIDGDTGLLYLMSGSGETHCFTLDGDVVWRRSMLEEFGRNTYPNGRIGAPTIEGDFVIFRGVTNNWGKQGPPRDRLYAFDKRTGEPVWAATGGVGPPYLKDSCFSTPVYDWWDGKRVLYTGLGSGAVVCINAWTGEPIWRSQQIIGGINSSVVLHDGKVVVIHGRQNLDTTETGRLLALKIPDPSRVEAGKGPFLMDAKDEAWRQQLSMFTSSPVLVGDRLYQIVQTGELCCVDVAKGKTLWHEKLAPQQIHASPLWADGKLYVPMLDGHLWIIRPNDTGIETLAKVKLEGECLGSPAAWNGKIWVHTTERLYCFGKKQNDPANLPAVTMVKAEYPKPGKPASLQVVPNEVLLHPGEKETFRVYALDANGQRIGEVKYPVTWSKGKPAMDASFNDAGEMVAGTRASAGSWTAASGDLKGTIRGRIVPSLPHSEDFESYELTNTNPIDEAKFAHPPSHWITARLKWEVRENDGSKVLAKTTDALIHHRVLSFIGTPDESDYTVTADVMSDGNRRGMGEMGVINQRYLIKLRGNDDKIVVSSNVERFEATAEYRLKPKTWYRLKSEVEVADDGSATIRGKVWKRDEPEPDAWTIEAKHDKGHTHGSPGVFGFSPQRSFRVYVDNIHITPDSNEGAGS